MRYCTLCHTLKTKLISVMEIAKENEIYTFFRDDNILRFKFVFCVYAALLSVYLKFDIIKVTRTLEFHKFAKIFPT